MKLTDYKKLLKGREKDISAAADIALKQDWRIGATGALNRALGQCGLAHPDFVCKNENTANAVLSHCDRKAGKW